jgi:PIN domain nuclease of toxin-antitoxin system
MIYLDTHAVVWLYSGDVDRFPVGAREALENDDIGASPVVLLELQYLWETGRIREEGHVIASRLSGMIGLRIVEQSFTAVVQESMRQNWTRDPFDRFIASQAILEGVPLLTKDKTIRRHCSLAFWEHLPKV